MRGTADLVLSCSPLFKTNENLPEMCERLSNADNQRRILTQQKITVLPTLCKEEKDLKYLDIQLVNQLSS